MSVDLNGVVAFLPGSQIDNKSFTNDTKELLKKPIDLMILKMDKYRGNIVVSRKVISDNQLKEQRQKILSGISDFFLAPRLKTIRMARVLITINKLAFVNDISTSPILISGPIL